MACSRREMQDAAILFGSGKDCLVVLMQAIFGFGLHQKMPLKIPFGRQITDAPAARHVERVLIGTAQVFMLGKERKAFILNLFAQKTRRIDDQHARIDISVRRNAQRILHVFHVIVLERIARRSNRLPLQIGIAKLCNIGKQHQIAVEIDDLFEKGQKLRSKQPVIHGDGIMRRAVQVRRPHKGRDVLTHDAHAPLRKPLQPPDVSLRQFGMKDKHGIPCPPTHDR